MVLKQNTEREKKVRVVLEDFFKKHWEENLTREEKDELVKKIYQTIKEDKEKIKNKK